MDKDFVSLMKLMEYHYSGFSSDEDDRTTSVEAQYAIENLVNSIIDQVNNETPDEEITKNLIQGIQKVDKLLLNMDGDSKEELRKYFVYLKHATGNQYQAKEYETFKFLLRPEVIRKISPYYEPPHKDSLYYYLAFLAD